MKTIVHVNLFCVPWKQIDSPLKVNGTMKKLCSGCTVFLLTSKCCLKFVLTDSYLDTLYLGQLFSFYFLCRFFAK